MADDELRAAVEEALSLSHEVDPQSIVDVIAIVREHDDRTLSEEFAIPDGAFKTSKRTFGTVGLARSMAKLYGGPVSRRLVTRWETLDE